MHGLPLEATGKARRRRLGDGVEDRDEVGPDAGRARFEKRGAWNTLARIVLTVARKEDDRPRMAECVRFNGTDSCDN